MKKHFHFLFILFLLAISSCVTVNPYHCPATTDQRYRYMDHRDKKSLERKPNKYKRREPSYNQQEGIGEDFDYKIK